MRGGSSVLQREQGNPGPPHHRAAIPDRDALRKSILVTEADLCWLRQMPRPRFTSVHVPASPSPASRPRPSCREADVVMTSG